MPDPVLESPVQSAIKDQLQVLATESKDKGDRSVALNVLEKLSERPGWKTTEFYLALIMSAVGGVMAMIPGKELYGAILASASVVSYNLSRGIAKTKPPA